MAEWIARYQKDGLLRREPEAKSKACGKLEPQQMVTFTKCEDDIKDEEFVHVSIVDAVKQKPISRYVRVDKHRVDS